MNNFLKSTEFLDFYHPNFNTVEQIFNSQNNNLELVVDLYNWVRDAFIYDPYHLDITQNGLTASSVLSKKRAWCVEKSILLASLARKFGFPSKLGFAIVKNHLEISKLKDFLKREEIVFHGYAEIFLDNK